jgi:hypothetical protein
MNDAVEEFLKTLFPPISVVPFADNTMTVEEGMINPTGLALYKIEQHTFLFIPSCEPDVGAHAPSESVPLLNIGSSIERAIDSSVLFGDADTTDERKVKVAEYVKSCNEPFSLTSHGCFEHDGLGGSRRVLEEKFQGLTGQWAYLRINERYEPLEKQPGVEKTDAVPSDLND